MSTKTRRITLVQLLFCPRKPNETTCGTREQRLPISVNASEEAARVCPAATSIGNRVGSWTGSASNLFRTIRGFLSDCLDRSAFQHVSLGREVSIVFTASGPLIYRLKSSTRPLLADDETNWSLLPMAPDAFEGSLGSWTDRFRAITFP